jgi:hypothetical protein
LQPAERLSRRDADPHRRSGIVPERDGRRGVNTTTAPNHRHKETMPMAEATFTAVELVATIVTVLVISTVAVAVVLVLMP